MNLWAGPRRQTQGVTGALLFPTIGKRVDDDGSTCKLGFFRYAATILGRLSPITKRAGHSGTGVWCPAHPGGWIAGAWGAGAAASHWMLFLMIIGDQHNSDQEIGHDAKYGDPQHPRRGDRGGSLKDLQLSPDLPVLIAPQCRHDPHSCQTLKRRPHQIEHNGFRGLAHTHSF